MRFLATALVLALAAVGTGSAGPANATAQLHDLLHREWEARLAQEPLFATSVGRHEYDDRLPDASAASLERWNEASRGFLAELSAIDRDALGDEDQVSYDMIRRELEDRIADFELGGDQLAITSEGGFHSELARLPDEVPLATVAGYENYVARLRAFPRYFAEETALLQEGLERGMTVPKVVLTGFSGTISAHVVDDPQKSAYAAPFERFPEAVPEADRARLRQVGLAAIRDAVVPAYRRFLDFVENRYVPGARGTIGASELPDGAAYYRQQIRRYTTLDATPDEIHQIGLQEVARIDGEMRSVIQRTGWTGDFAHFIHFLRTDPRFYAKTPEELLERAALIAKRMDGKLPSLFATLPRLPYGIEPVPAAIAPKYTSGRYVPAPYGSTRAGTYWVNTYDLPARPLYALEALTFHEAVPGHHLQIALASELTDLPEFRRFDYISAFGEGWGLYAERLGKEAGFYTDPYSDFGRLTYEMWRACRLVVDTGLHALGWSRQKAMDYLAAHTALSLHEVETETDRYISWPGQALAYKLGELEILRQRVKAEAALGPRFDVRRFHDAVLAHGSVPLPVLEREIDRFIAESSGGI